jgi:hypothetical protein
LAGQRGEEAQGVDGEDFGMGLGEWTADFHMFGLEGSF